MRKNFLIIIVFDLTAHGKSAGKEPEEISVFAEDVEYSIVQLQQKNQIGKKVVLLGYSMGGAITCEIALRKKLKLAGMVLLSSGADLSHFTPLVDELKNIPIAEFDAVSVFPFLFGTDTSEDKKKYITELFHSTMVSNEVGMAI